MELFEAGPLAAGKSFCGPSCERLEHDQKCREYQWLSKWVHTIQINESNMKQQEPKNQI